MFIKKKYLVTLLVSIMCFFLVAIPTESKVYQLLKHGGNPLLKGTMRSTGLDFQDPNGQYNATFTSDIEGGAFFKLHFTALDDNTDDTIYGFNKTFVIQNDASGTDTVYCDRTLIINNDTTGAGYGFYIAASDDGDGVVKAGIKIENLQETDIDITDGIIIVATTADSIEDAIDVSDAEITNAINIGANVLLGSTPTFNFTNFDIASTGHITVQPGYGLDVNAGGELKLGDTTATTVGIGGTAATTLNLGAAAALTRAINIGTGTGTDTIKIGTGASGTDDIDIGAALADVDITGASDIVAGTGDALTITGNAASTWSTTSGDLTIEAQITSLNLKGDEADQAAIFLDADATADTGITILTGATNGLSYDGGPFKSATDFDLTLSGAESFDITSAASSAVDVIDIDITSTVAGVVRGIVIDQLTGGTEPVDAAIEIINNDADDAMTVGILFTATQTIATAISAGSANIGTALDVAANDITGTTGLINYTNFDVAATGHVTTQAGYGIDVNAGGELKVGDTTATTLGIGGTAATTINLGAAGALARAINIGTGTAVDTIKIGTGGTLVDDIDIGDSTADVAITANSGIINFTNFDVAATGHVTTQIAYGIDVNTGGELKVGDTTATTLGIGGTAATTINLGAGGALGRAINIGTGTGLDTIIIGGGGTAVDNIDIGDSTADVAITANVGVINFTNFDVDSSGNTTVGGVLSVHSINYAISSAADDDYIVTLSPAITSYVAGLPIYFDASVDNSGACTLNVNGLGAKNIKLQAGGDPTDDYLEADGITFVMYDGTSFILMTPDGNP